MLYNSYNFSIGGSRPQRVILGVAQGSLVSPLLYNWYVDGLVAKLSELFDTSKVFAYADDTAILCLGINDIRRAVSRIKEWSE